MLDSLLKQLEEHYQMVVIGYQEPDVLHCSKSLSNYIATYFNFPGGAEGFKFNNATIKVDSSMPDNEVLFENTKYPEGRKTQKYNIRFKVEL